jgi:hypothetical protein
VFTSLGNALFIGFLPLLGAEAMAGRYGVRVRA